MIKWKKKGLVFVPKSTNNWSISHAQVPTPIYFKEQSLIRIYYSTRRIDNKSVISFIDVNSDNPNQILYTHDKPVLDIGKIGTFDDSGVMPSWLVQNNGVLYLYYIGWNVRNTVPYHNSVGLATSIDGGITFKRYSEGPLWDRDFKEPYFSASSCVLLDNGIWKNWYLSCTEYRTINGKVEPRYHIKYAESNDGINWQRNGVVAIDYKSENEAGIVKASVYKSISENKYLMWFSYRNFDNYRTDKLNSYKIGYAESVDGINWVRNDNNAGIDLSDDGWDSEMQCYPHVIEINGNLLLFYNGNGFGQSGFGYCIS
jgi:hypothetical protein